MVQSDLIQTEGVFAQDAVVDEFGLDELYEQLLTLQLIHRSFEPDGIGTVLPVVILSMGYLRSAQTIVLQAELYIQTPLFVVVEEIAQLDVLDRELEVAYFLEQTLEVDFEVGFDLIFVDHLQLFGVVESVAE